MTPTTLTAIAESALLAGLTDTFVRQYAGEFFTIETASALQGELTQFDGVLYDVETIEADTSRAASDNKSSAADIYTIVFYCCKSNFTDQGTAWNGSYELAYTARRTLEGSTVAPVSDDRGGGVWKFLNITREFHIPQMSCHSLRMRIQVPAKIEL